MNPAHAISVKNPNKKIAAIFLAIVFTEKFRSAASDIFLACDTEILLVPLPPLFANSPTTQ
jgi:hypothetical protein